jgi:hypothetical protein
MGFLRVLVFVAAISVAMTACGDDDETTAIEGRTAGERAAARAVANDHTAGNDGSEERASRVGCRRTGTSDFPTPAHEAPKGVYKCAADFPDGFTEDCEVDEGRDQVSCVPRGPGGSGGTGGSGGRY